MPKTSRMLSIHAFSTDTGSIVITGKVPRSGDMMSDEAQFGASMEYQSPVTETMLARTAQSFADDAATKLGPIPGLKDVAIWMLGEVTRP